MDRYQASRFIKDAKKNSQRKYETNSKKRLMNNVAKKLQTTMIGALAQFEKQFGELWGIDEDIGNLTPEQQFYRSKWESVRTEVLNNGNNQIRAAMDELSQYTITWNRFQTSFIVKGRN